MQHILTEREYAEVKKLPNETAVRIGKILFRIFDSKPTGIERDTTIAVFGCKLLETGSRNLETTLREMEQANW